METAASICVEMMNRQIREHEETEREIKMHIK